MMNKLIIASILLVLTACTNTSDIDPQNLIDSSIKSHGFDRLSGKNISFKFRKKSYSVSRDDNKYVYTRTFTDSSGIVKDVLTNSTVLTRTVNDSLLDISELEAEKTIEAVNSVLYFFQLPYGLNDNAVNKKYAGTDKIDNQDYHLVSVTFGKNGGGADYQDEYLYWINQKDHTIDYLAYNYIVNEGGVRFRKAINRRIIDGLTFQDYINYKPHDKNTPLKALSKLYAEGNLIELSRIVSEEVLVKTSDQEF